MSSSTSAPEPTIRPPFDSQVNVSRSLSGSLAVAMMCTRSPGVHGTWTGRAVQCKRAGSRQDMRNATHTAAATIVHTYGHAAAVTANGVWLLNSVVWRRFT